MIKELLSKRLLCSACVLFLIVQALVMYITSGQPYRKVPASSIFYDMQEDVEILLQGQVYKKTNTSKNQVLYLKNNSIRYKQLSFEEPKIIIYLNTDSIRKEKEISIGEIVRIRGRASVFEAARNPGNFDQKLYYAKENIHGFLWCKEIISVSGEKDVLQESLYQLRKAWKALILENMTEDTGGVLSSILLGEKSEIDVEIKELYQKIGISHILAISGLHISFIGLGVYKLFRRIGCPYFISGVFSALLLTGYVIMIGISISVIRAYIMLMFRILADITGRVYDIYTALAFSAAVSVVYQPLALMDAGFYLSYSAICGIFVVKPQLEKIGATKSKLMKAGLTSLSINLAMFPILLWFFYEFPTYSLVMNLIVLPLSSPILGLGFLGSLGIVAIKPVGEICFWSIEHLLQFFSFLGRIGSRLPFSTIVFGRPEWYQIGIYYFALILILVYLQVVKQEISLKKNRKYVWLLILMLISGFVKWPSGKVQVAFLDVGQGDCIFVKGPYGKNYLIDGGSSDVKQVGRYRIESFLKSQGVGVLDYVFVSHGDKDHYSGILELIERQQMGVKIKQLILPSNYQKDEDLICLLESALKYKVEVSVIKKGQRITEGDFEICCLQPQEGEFCGNAGSMVVSVSFREFNLLCTGDVEADGETKLCTNLNKKSYDVLKVAHHGSKNSTGEDLLKIVRPRIAIVSAGKNNSYGHPHSETLERLRKYGSRIYQTRENGAIMLESDGDFIDIFVGCR